MFERDLDGCIYQQIDWVLTQGKTLVLERVTITILTKSIKSAIWLQVFKDWESFLKSKYLKSLSSGNLVYYV